MLLSQLKYALQDIFGSINVELIVIDDITKSIAIALVGGGLCHAVLNAVAIYRMGNNTVPNVSRNSRMKY